MPRHRSSAVPLAWLYVGLIVYASLYPFTGWRVPGVGPLDFMLLGWPRWWTGFDLISNLFGYLPLGFLLFVALVRGGRPAQSSLWLAVAIGSLLSFSMETLQNYLPQRVSSNVDFGLNALGTMLGVAIGSILHWRGGIDRWQRTRERWFIDRSAGGVALLVLWPVGLLFPTAVPFGLGHVLGRIQPWLAKLMQGTPAESWTAEWAGLVEQPTGASTLGPAGELSIIVLGLLAPSLIAFTIAAPGWRRTALVIATMAIGCATTTLSTALNFGPQHASAWITAGALQGVLIGTGAAVLLSLVPTRVAAGFGLIALTALVMLVAQAPADQYFAQSLNAWEQGRFIRFHGAAQWVGWAWPYAGLLYLLVRLAATRQPQGGQGGF
ncbi:MAG: VanZ family protein [Pseudomonadota bacterium]|nr:VanZ family protein [Pseudomonadota bacterium]